MKLSAVVSLYVAHKRALGHRFRAEDAILRAFCKAVGDRPIATVEAQSVLVFLHGRGPVTAYWTKKYRVLFGLYRFALTRGCADRSPLPRASPKPTVPAFVPYIYSAEELKRLLDAVPAACAGRVPIEAEASGPCSCCSTAQRCVSGKPWRSRGVTWVCATRVCAFARRSSSSTAWFRWAKI